ncbi:hypothetical protein L484_005977 [Morus notabilis]|uniref:Uncharacterized protein n=1 Tax=Morus notabilis TaxID=981085 RepID=W9SHF1_9ROSA|nr:hypothetical protein L484_005977 [Morus notabilis]
MPPSLTNEITFLEDSPSTNEFTKYSRVESVPTTSSSSMKRASNRRSYCFASVVLLLVFHN